MFCIACLVSEFVLDRYTDIIRNLKLFLKKRSIAIAPPEYVWMLCIYGLIVLLIIIQVPSVEVSELAQKYKKSFVLKKWSVVYLADILVSVRLTICKL